jgi:hypothetical protein
MEKPMFVLTVESTPHHLLASTELAAGATAVPASTLNYLAIKRDT